MKLKLLLAGSVVLNLTLLGTLSHLSRSRVECPPDPVADYAEPPVWEPDCEVEPQECAHNGFQPTRELWLPAKLPGNSPELVDLESGRRMTQPAIEEFDHDARALVKWIKTHRLDLSLTVFDRTDVLGIGYYLAVVPVPSSKWDTLTAEEICDHTELAHLADPRRSTFNPRSAGTDTFLFRTQEGTRGILQLLGPSRDRRSLGVRYKMVGTPAFETMPPLAGTS